ncbi:hypothetical protein [Cytobacillus firmus]|uniref:hypothetical protein n=1 Tax=Cytobacillus firmus TaxID=1399 RepID=UPI001A7ED709|nr:hypothetical protein [Cytobacillus firmus]
MQLEKTHYTSDHIIYNVKSVNQDALQLINSDESFEAVYSIEPMPKYKVALDMGPTDDMDVDVLLPEDGKEYTTVGILDNGIANIPHLKPWLSEASWTAYPEAYMKKNHGIFVSGVVVYGDQFEDREWVGKRC